MPIIGDIKKDSNIQKSVWHVKSVWRACVNCGKERWVRLYHGEPESPKCRSCTQLGHKPSYRPIDDVNNQWAGNEVGYTALHGYIGRRLPKPELCPECSAVPPRDLACITGVYSRELKNWKWLCRRCHMIFDGRLKKLVKQAKRANEARWSKPIPPNEHGRFAKQLAT